MLTHADSYSYQHGHEYIDKDTYRNGNRNDQSKPVANANAVSNFHDRSNARVHVG